VTDQLEHLFADLRADTMTQVRAPGVAAARHTVHRRRRTGASVAAGAALAIAGAVAWTTIPGDDRTTPVAGRQLADTAQAAVRDSAGSYPTGESSGPLTGTVTTRTQVNAGTYLLFVACAGAAMGDLAVLVRGPGRLVTAAAPCEAAPVPERLRFVMESAGIVTIELRGGPAGIGRAGYAYKMVNYSTDLVYER
jgi:hypothetical protein